MKFDWRILSFLALCIIQLGYFSYSILQSESINSSGEELKFKIDLSERENMYQGEFLKLYFHNNSIEVSDASEWKYGEEVFIRFKNDRSGFAIIEEIRKLKPSTFSKSQIYGKVSHVNKDLNKVYINYPFDKYFMGAQKMSKFKELSLKESDHVFCTIVLANGHFRIKDIFYKNKTL